MLFICTLPNSLLLLKLSFKIIKQKKIILLDTLFYVVLNLLIYAFYSSIVYFVYGIHLFNLRTINILQYFSLQQHITHIFVLCSLLLISSWVTLIGKFSTVFSTINFLNNKPVRIFDGLVKSSQKFREISILSLIYTLDILQSVFGVFEIFREKIIELKIKLEGLSFKQKTNILNFLDVPLMAFEDKSLHMSIKESKELMQSKFGYESIFKFSMFFLSLIILVVVFSLFDRVLAYFFNSVISFHFCLVTTLLLWSFLSTSLSIFKAVIYNYCNDRPINIFEGYINRLIG
jgi:hypothetical protein